MVNEPGAGDARPSPLVLALGVSAVVFHLYLIFSGLIPNLISRPIHLALALPWIFVIGNRATGWRRWLSWAVCAGGVAAALYIVANRAMLDDQYGSLEGTFQRVLAVFLLVLVIEMARRAVRLALPVVAMLALAYGLFGSYLPGQFGHPGIPFDSFLGTLVIAEGGIWGPLTGISVNVVAIFVILGAVMSVGEGGQAFMALAVKAAGRLTAGAAKVSVLASAFFGSISGSASANVASTGAVTLPAMKKLGYPAGFAAGVEATASTGGQIMPPLMGAGAFIMAELLGLNYSTIVGAAFLPAVLFFLAVWIAVDLFAARYGLKPMRADEIPTLSHVARLGPFFLIPFGVLLVVLFGTGRTAQYGAGIAIFTAALLLCVDGDWRYSARRWVQRLSQASIVAARQIATIASIIICAGIVIGVLNMTGLGIKITAAILTFSGGQLWAGLLLTAIACLILGMEVPTTAAYVIAISVTGPALMELGLDPLETHLFVFWYALLSTITPPVCGTVFIAAGMAGAPWLNVSSHAMRLGLGLYVIPLALVANPMLIQLGTHPIGALLVFVKIAAGLWGLAFGVISNRTPLLARAAVAGAGIGVMFWPVPGLG
ncbi:MAG: TRAP transporter permease [Alphaproteobacteria bacterium]